MSNAELSIPNLERKLEEEGLNATHWREVGLKLGFPFSSLQVIEADVYPPSQIRCLHEMLNDWCRLDPTATMEDYTRALRLLVSLCFSLRNQKAWVCFICYPALYWWTWLQCWDAHCIMDLLLLLLCMQLSLGNESYYKFMSLKFYSKHVSFSLEKWAVASRDVHETKSQIQPSLRYSCRQSSYHSNMIHWFIRLHSLWLVWLLHKQNTYNKPPFLTVVTTEHKLYMF